MQGVTCNPTIITSISEIHNRSSPENAELEEEAAELDGILNVIDKIIDSTEVEY